MSDQTLLLNMIMLIFAEVLVLACLGWILFRVIAIETTFYQQQNQWQQQLKNWRLQARTLRRTIEKTKSPAIAAKIPGYRQWTQLQWLLGWRNTFRRMGS